MNKVNFPLKNGDKGPAVADLQDGLRFLVEKGQLLATGDPMLRKRILDQLTKERSDQVYGDTTCNLVTIFQEDHQIAASGDVDQKTAGLMNALLEELGAFSEPVSPDSVFLDPRYIVPCQVLDARGAPVAGLRVEAYNRDPRAFPNALGEPAVTGRDGLVTFPPKPESWGLKNSPPVKTNFLGVASDPVGVPAVIRSDHDLIAISSSGVLLSDEQAKALIPSINEALGSGVVQHSTAMTYKNARTLSMENAAAFVFTAKGEGKLIPQGPLRAYIESAGWKWPFQ